jgi:AraC-like DNA-binding protein
MAAFNYTKVYLVYIKFSAFVNRGGGAPGRSPEPLRASAKPSGARLHRRLFFADFHIILVSYCGLARLKKGCIALFKILLIENNYFRAGWIKSLIPWADYNCSLTIDYIDVSGLEKIHDLRPDIVMLSSELLFVRITQFVQISREQNPNIRFIILSNHAGQIGAGEDNVIYLDGQRLTPQTMLNALTKILDMISNHDRGDHGGEAARDDEGKLRETLAAIGQPDMPAYVLLLDTRYGIRGIDYGRLQKQIHSVLGEEGNGWFITRSGELCLVFRFASQGNPFYAFKFLDQTLAKLLAEILTVVPYKKPVILEELVSDAFAADAFRNLQNYRSLAYFCRERTFFSGKQILSPGPGFDYEQFAQSLPRLLGAMLANRSVEAVRAIEEIYAGLLKPSMSLSGLEYVRNQMQSYLDLYGIIRGFPQGRTRLFLTGFSYLEEEMAYLSAFLEGLLAPPEGTRNFHPKILEALMIIEKRYMEFLTLDDICQELGMTKAYFCTLFKQTIHQGYVEYLNRIRVYKVLNLIHRGEHQVERLAKRNGFSEAKYFSKVFKKFVGMPPSCYIKNSGFAQRAPAYE